MKIQILDIKFKIFRENADNATQLIEDFCNKKGIIYTYSVRHNFFPFKSVIAAKFEGNNDIVEELQKYITSMFGVK